MTDQDFEKAMIASLEDPTAVQRDELANRMLNQLDCIQQSHNKPFKLCLSKNRGDGLCFFRCIAEQANLSNEDDVQVRLLAAYTFIEVARDTNRNADENIDESFERLAELQGISEYQYAIENDLLDTFDLYNLDKIEGVLKRNLSLNRRYASGTDIVTLLKHFDLTCIMLKPYNWVTDGKWQMFLPDAANTVITNNIQPEDTDLLLVHHTQPDHFDSVQGETNQCWTVANAKAKRISDALAKGISKCPRLTESIISKKNTDVGDARLELLHFVIAHNPKYTKMPEILHWISWVAFARKYDFITSRHAGDIQSARTWLKQRLSNLEQKQINIYAEAVQYFFGQTYVLFRAAQNASSFAQLCHANIKKQITDIDSDSKIEDARSAFTQSAMAIVQNIHRNMPLTKLPSVFFRGLRLKHTDEADSVIRNMCDGQHQIPFSCSTMLSVAMRFIDPDIAQPSALTIRLQQQSRQKKRIHGRITPYIRWLAGKRCVRLKCFRTRSVASILQLARNLSSKYCNSLTKDTSTSIANHSNKASKE